MNNRILITGSSGLIGSALRMALEKRGDQAICFDVRERGASHGDVIDRARLAEAISGVHGIIHLAAVSRVIWGERDPEGCWATNVGGTSNVLELAAVEPGKPWVIFASSREVYGQPDTLPVTEDAPLRPVNIYGQSKVEGERLVSEARQAGVRAATVRLSNVFGSVHDHPDRVVPAFARGAVSGIELRVDGGNHTFDFTYVDDVARGIVQLVDLLGSDAGAPPPPIHFVSGSPTTLSELSALAIRIAGTQATVRHASPRNFDVAQFYGNPSRAIEILGWQPKVSLHEGLAKLIMAFQLLGTAQHQEDHVL